MINNKYIMMLILFVTYIIYGFYKLFTIHTFEVKATFIWKTQLIALISITLLLIVIIFNEDSIQKIFGFIDDNIYGLNGKFSGKFMPQVFKFLIIILLFNYTYLTRVINVNFGEQRIIVINAKVLKKNKFKKGSCWNISVKYDFNVTQNICMKKDIYTQLKTGDSFEFKVYEGVLGVKYYYDKFSDLKIKKSSSINKILK